jgi:hypothetical protein
MNAKADDPIVVVAINTLIGVVQFGIKDRNHTFIPLKVSKLDKQRLYYFDEATNSDKLVSAFHQEVWGARTPDRWLRCVWFKGLDGNEISLKKHLKTKHGLRIT